MNQVEIGKKIRGLRKEKGVTQEVLADFLGVTAQAISKWENEASSPDISLLPNISIYFGVTIDELFSLTDEEKLGRIENMIDSNRYLSNSEFVDSEKILSDMRKHQSLKIKALTLLSYLYLSKVGEYQNKAANCALKGLELDHESSSLHKALNNAHKVPIGDWNVMNHAERIDYYDNFVREHPTYKMGYFWLLDALISDGRCSEASDVLNQYERVVGLQGDWRILHYRALIASKTGNMDEANKFWDEMTQVSDQASGAFFERAVAHAYRGEWDDAISCFEIDFEAMKKPRYTDSLDAIAKILEIKKEYAEAINTYEAYIELLEQEWMITEGELFDYPCRQIERLRIKLSSQ